MSDDLHNRETGMEVAIVGMACRFPGAADLEQFWHNLVAGVESISVFTREELEAAGEDPAMVAQPNYVPVARNVDDIDMFDAGFFGYSPREAEVMDPQQRVFLEGSWEALEHAGYDVETCPGLIGVYAGARLSAYLMNVYRNPQVVAAVGDFHVQIANDKDYVATRVSYKLNLGGPSVTVQTACSTSLVAVHLACQGLLSGECDLALAGGSALRVPQVQGYLFREGDVGSPDGHCRAFDARARGTVFGSGLGVVVLKRLEEALADGDSIYAVVKGSAINNDGSQKVGFTAPGADGQARVVRAAQVIAGVHPETIGYVEAHGTGTPVGDPIEVAALTRAFREKTDKRGFCAIGSVKSNIGHAGAAAGAAGLIKTALALKRGMIPPSLLFESPNPEIDFDSSPFYVNTRLTEWKGNGAPRRAGVSAFGIGGTNAHVILEEAPEVEPSGPSRPAELLLLSARTPAALDAATANLAAYLASPETAPAPLADVAYTLQVGRKAMEHRRMVVVREGEAAAAVLADPKRVATGSARSKNPPVSFLFSGQGAQYVEMGAGLYGGEPAFRDALDRCAGLLAGPLGLDLRRILFPGAGEAEEAAARLEQTALTQPALFSLEYALAALWREWGVQPQAMLGHSVGEYVAACLAGVMTLEEALALVAARGRLMQGLPAGAMAMVPLPEDQVAALLGEGLSLAAVNGPSRCVVSGPAEVVADLEQRLAGGGVDCRRLHTSHAFHSAMMEPILEPFLAEVRQVALKPPAIPYVSNVTGSWITEAEATDPAYYARHLRRPVRFAAGLAELFARKEGALLEVGPGKTLATLARQHPGRPAGMPVVSSLRHPQDSEPDVPHMLAALGQLWVAGLRADWRAFHARERRLRVPLPTYPFERRRYWLDMPEEGALFEGAGVRKKKDVADWFYLPAWKPSLPPAAATAADSDGPRRWLLFADDGGLAAALADRLLAEGREVVGIVSPATAGEAAEIGPARAAGGPPARPRIDPARREDYDALLGGLRSAGSSPDAIVHLWGLTRSDPAAGPDPGLDAVQDRGFYSLLHLAQALGRTGVDGDVRIGVVTDRLQRVVPGDAPRPEKATVLGPVKVIPQENPRLSSVSIDLEPAAGPAARDGDVEAILAEMSAPAAVAARQNVVAYRGGERWVRGYEAVRLSSPEREPRLRQEGVYLITGGLGGFGLAFAEHLARAVRARLVLVGRSALPEREAWEGWISAHGPEDPTSARLARLLALEELGAEVMAASADVADEAAMRAVVARARSRFGAVHGVIHAAGVPGGGLIPLKTRDMAERVLAPKVRGTLALEAALAAPSADQPAEPPDFFLLCSSTIAVFGGFGQVDYCAANSFLDAFAQARSAAGTAVTSVNWSAWQEVGMAVNTAPPPSLSGSSPGRSEAGPREAAPVPGETAGLAAIHPLLDELVRDEPAHQVFSTAFSPERHWVLGEHRILGTGTVPGTTWLELARAGFAQRSGPGPVEIRDLLFLTPVMAKDGESRETRLVLDHGAEGATFRVLSRGSGDSWQEHARGTIAPLAASSPGVRDLDELRMLCGDREILIDQSLKVDGKREFVTWGPRWQSIRRVHAGDKRALIELALPDEFAADLDEMVLHPALVDVATAVGSAMIGGQSNYLPLSYGRVEVHDRLPGHLFSLIELKSEGAGHETLSFDVLLLDEEGRVRVAVHGFTMKRVGEAASRFQAASERPAAAPEAGPERGKAAVQGLFAAGGMLPAEGVEVLRRVLAVRRLPQIVVSPRDLHALLEQSRAADRSRLLEEVDRGVAQGPAHPRPDIQTPYEAPRNDVEARLAAIWQGVLGIEQVGVHDNFFDLGGDSVLGIQVIARAAEAGLRLSPEKLFEHQTIAELAESLGPVAAGEAPTAADEDLASGLAAASLSEAELDAVFSKLEELPS